MPLAEHDSGQSRPWLLREVSIHVPLAEHDSMGQRRQEAEGCFNSRAPRGARRTAIFFDSQEYRVSIHVPLAEHDSSTCSAGAGRARFNSRAPRGARLGLVPRCDEVIPFQFTCPSRSTTALLCAPTAFDGVSIHVPLAEHDGTPHVQCSRLQGFNSRAPRGARHETKADAATHLSVSIHVPLAEHDCVSFILPYCQRVSIHVPLAEHDVSY